MYRVEMAFGHCDSEGAALLDAQVAAAETIALKGFAQVFRGAQLVRHAGSYLNDYGHLMIEPCTIVWAYVDEIDKHVVHLHAVAATIAAVLRQESVLVMITRIDCVLDWIRPGTMQLADNSSHSKVHWSSSLSTARHSTSIRPKETYEMATGTNARLGVMGAT